MQVKIFHDTIRKDDIDAAMRKYANKKNKAYESIETRVNAFIRDKHVIDIQTSTAANFLSETMMTVTVLYDEIDHNN